MAGRTPLKNGAPRLLGRHDGREGRAYQRCYEALAQAFKLDTPLLRLEAGRVAALRVQLEIATANVMEATRMRRTGRGRRPAVREIERLSRRAGLLDGSYERALERLGELVGVPHPPALADAVAAARQSQPA
jgi:hypothetical protein